MCRLTIVAVVVLLCLVVGATPSDLSRVISGQVTNTKEDAEVNQLLEDVVYREMGGCSVIFAYEGRHPITTALASSASVFHTLGFTLFDLAATADLATIFQPKEEYMYDTRICQGYMLLVYEASWNQLMDLGPAAWAGHNHIFFLILPERRSAVVDVTSLLTDPALRFSAQVAAATKERNRWVLYANRVYVGKYRITAFAVDIWTPTQGFGKSKLLFDSEKMADLQGYYFAVAALPYSPFIMMANDSLPGPGKYRGLEVLLLDALAEAANFTYHYVAPEDGQWGRLTANGTWTGMIGMVVYERADWAVSDITFSPQRERYVDFCKTFVYDASELVTPRAQLLPQWLGPVRPFSLDVWIATLIMIIFSGPFLCFLARYCIGSNKPYVRYFQEVGNAVMFSLQPVFQRGSHRDIRETPGRLFNSAWLIFTMIVGISYSSSLTSFLVLPGLQKPIENLQQLVTSDIGWGKVYFGGVQSAMLEQTKDPVLIALREGVQWRDSLGGILQDVVKGTLATWDNSITTRLTIAVKFTDNQGQPMVHLPGFELLQERIAWPMQQHAPYKRRFDELIGRVVQAGLVQKWLQQLIFEEQSLARKQRLESSTKVESEDEGDPGQIVLSLAHFQGPFFVLILGYLAGGVALLLEVLFSFVLRTKSSPRNLFYS